MVGIATIALLERKLDISRPLFSRYWRDVHGVMAARIPGFDTYTQYHVLPLASVGASRTEPFEGIAVVTYASEADRAGLIHSEITQHIHRDEQNVFRRALLYNLDAGASRTLLEPPPAADPDKGSSQAGAFMLVPAGPFSLDDALRAVPAEGLVSLRSFDLRSGDPSAWNKTDVDEGGASRRFAGLLQGQWSTDASAQAAIRQVVGKSGGAIAAYAVEAAYVMVSGGRPTALGLRGLDALNTIQEAGAVNQLEPDVVAAIYGNFRR